MKSEENNMENEFPYGFCPICFRPGESRERRLNGNDRCKHGHVYTSSQALKKPTNVICYIAAKSMMDNVDPQDRLIFVQGDTEYTMTWEEFKKHASTNAARRYGHD